MLSGAAKWASDASVCGALHVSGRCRRGGVGARRKDACNAWMDGRTTRAFATRVSSDQRRACIPICMRLRPRHLLAPAGCQQMADCESGCPSGRRPIGRRPEGLGGACCGSWKVRRRLRASNLSPSCPCAPPLTHPLLPFSCSQGAPTSLRLPLPGAARRAACLGSPPRPPPPLPPSPVAGRPARALFEWRSRTAARMHACMQRDHGLGRPVAGSRRLPAGRARTRGGLG